VREAVAGDPLVTELIEAMLNARAALWKEYLKLHELVIKFVAGHELCRRLMQIPGVGPVAALSFVTAIDDPSRFKRSRDVAAYFGLTRGAGSPASRLTCRGGSARRATRTCGARSMRQPLPC
jgi:transposase